VREVRPAPQHPCLVPDDLGQGVVYPRSARPSRAAAKVWSFGGKLPILIEVVDDPAKIEAFVPQLEAMISEGAITLDAALPARGFRSVVPQRYAYARQK
jgi:hypothetical protein